MFNEEGLVYPKGGEAKMKKEVAKYILMLRDAAKATHQAEDRPIYEKYLADAAVILALVEENVKQDIIAEAVATHERLRGHTWLQDPVFKESSEAWEKVKKSLK